MIKLNKYIIEKLKINKDSKNNDVILLVLGFDRSKPIYKTFNTIDDTAKFIKDNNKNWNSCYSLDKNLIEEFNNFFIKRASSFDKFAEDNNIEVVTDILVKKLNHYNYENN